MNCFKKSQALSELAIFGAILLMVFAFMIRMGLMYMHRQDVNMKAFRMAMSLAIDVDRPDASSTVVLVEDKHIPDPRDIVGTGDIVSIQGDANIVWGNTLEGQTRDWTNYDDINTMHIKINDEEEDYRIEGYGSGLDAHPYVIFTEPFFAYTSSNGWELISQSDARIYDPDVPEPIAVYMDGAAEKDTITKVRFNGSQDVLNVVYAKPKPDPNKYQVLSFYVINSSNGEIDLDYTALNSDLDEDGIPDVTPDNMQGHVSELERLKRTDVLTLTEKPEGDGDYRESVTKQKVAGKIEHRVKTNSGEDNFDYNGDMGALIKSNTTWKTGK